MKPIKSITILLVTVLPGCHVMAVDEPTNDNGLSIESDRFVTGSLRMFRTHCQDILQNKALISAEGG